MEKMKRVFSGIQPTGEIHLGNYLGAIKNWASILDGYDCIFSIVDYHAATIEYEVAEMAPRIFDAALDNIAAGLDPARCTLFVQSWVPEHTELCWVLNTVTPMGELERMTQFKEKSRQNEQNINAGLFDYPVLQTADIVIYKATHVPVGEDQVQHVELAREVVRKFNNRYGEIFPEPDSLLSSTPRLMGLDGKSKMSKSKGNTISLMETRDSLWQKLSTAFTDESRLRRSDPGNPDVCNLFTIHKSLTEEGKVSEIDSSCRKAAIGCVDCKKILLESLWREMEPIQERKRRLLKDPGFVLNALDEGARRCREIASATMDEVREAMGLSRSLVAKAAKR
jgi:tryptophanyl-tRNA synthetase